jgi:hypothetical protein
MVQFTPPVSVGCLRKNVKCTVQVGQPGHLRDCGALHTYSSKQGPSNLIRHLRDWHAKEYAETDRLSPRMARASKEKADVLCPGEKIGALFFLCILVAVAECYIDVVFPTGRTSGRGWLAACKMAGHVGRYTEVTQHQLRALVLR